MIYVKDRKEECYTRIIVIIISGNLELDVSERM